ncbi:hypothetical protein Bca4012_074495 [Brassica carinata]
MGMDLRVVLAEEWWEERGRDSSLDGERDLGLMVTDFLETGGGGSGGGGGDSWCSSDSDSEFLDPSYLSDQIQHVRVAVHRVSPMIPVASSHQLALMMFQF